MDRQIVRSNLILEYISISFTDHFNQPDLFGTGTGLVFFLLFDKFSSDVGLTFYFKKIRWFQNVVLANRACGGGIVAWRGPGPNSTDVVGNRHGAYIADSSIIRVSIALLYHT